MSLEKQNQNFGNVRKSEDGFTLIELTVVTLMIGIFAGIVAPACLGMINRGKLNSALSELRGLLQVSQREAVKKSQGCTLTLPTTGTVNPNLLSTCTVTDDFTLEGVAIAYNNSGSKKINFNFRGGTSPLRTIVIYQPNVREKKCLVVSNGIGMIRTGDYISNDLSNISATSCNTSP